MTAPRLRQRAARGIAAAALSAAVLLGGAPAHAQQGMPNSRNMTCPELQALIARRGAVVLATGPNTYNRYVNNVGFCTTPEVVKPEWVPTRSGACYTGGGTCWDPSTFSGNR